MIISRKANPCQMQAHMKVCYSVSKVLKDIDNRVKTWYTFYKTECIAGSIVAASVNGIHRANR